MSQSAPRAAFSVTVTADEYRAAARIASHTAGQLRGAWLGFALCMLLVLTVAGALVAYPWAALLLLLCGGVIALTALCLMRHAFLRTAARQYLVFSSLFPTVQVTLWEDMLEYNGENCRRQEPYALFSRLVETRTTLVLLHEDGSFLVIPKNEAISAETLDFLRRVFARKYRKIR